MPDNTPTQQETRTPRVLRVRSIPVEIVPQANPAAPPALEPPPDPAGPQSRHVERTRLVVRRLDPHHPLDTREESWERQGGSFVTTETHAQVLTASSKLASPQDIKGFCSSCGGADTEFRICARTGVLLCLACVRYFTNAEGPIPVSRAALDELNTELNTWQVHDCRRNTMKAGALANLFPYLGRLGVSSDLDE